MKRTGQFLILVINEENVTIKIKNSTLTYLLEKERQYIS